LQGARQAAGEQEQPQDEERRSDYAGHAREAAALHLYQDAARADGAVAEMTFADDLVQADAVLRIVVDVSSAAPLLIAVIGLVLEDDLEARHLKVDLV
jgi:hypothetical protein